MFTSRDVKTNNFIIWNVVQVFDETSQTVAVGRNQNPLARLWNEIMHYITLYRKDIFLKCTEYWICALSSEINIEHLQWQIIYTPSNSKTILHWAYYARSLHGIQCRVIMAYQNHQWNGILFFNLTTFRMGEQWDRFLISYSFTLFFHIFFFSMATMTWDKDIFRLPVHWKIIAFFCSIFAQHFFGLTLTPEILVVEIIIYQHVLKHSITPPPRKTKGQKECHLNRGRGACPWSWSIF